jgi:hypothetical protein
MRAHRRTRPRGARRTAYDALLSAHLAGSAERPDDLTGYLDHLAGLRRFAFHGTSQEGLIELRPRQPRDIREFGSQNAVYASPDPHWAMFFALVDRAGVRMLINGSFALRANARIRWHQRDVRVKDPAKPLLSKGYLYVLPRATFRAEPRYRGIFDLAHWVSDVPVRPVFALPVRPEDYPMSGDIRAVP